ncbi:MAG: tRNA (5-methylaminomethyl-2-thiouridine)(34)-methyltransferase MnmD [Bacteroidota bacterium]
MIVQTVATIDGTVTLYVPALNEHYHSVHGAMQESMHVFIRAGLLEAAKTKKELQIFEMGFGTGLNALLTWRWAQMNALNIHYTSVEKFPLEKTVIDSLNYAEKDETVFFEQIHSAEWNKQSVIAGNFNLQKKLGDISEINFPQKSFDVIYFDAFAPRVQPELWTDEIFGKMFSLLNPAGILVTYCAKGEVKRSMKRAGFEVETLAGPPGKREMTRGRKI